MLRGPSPVTEGLVGDDLLGCGPFDKQSESDGSCVEVLIPNIDVQENDDKCEFHLTLFETEEMDVQMDQNWRTCLKQLRADCVIMALHLMMTRWDHEQRNSTTNCC